VIVGYAKNHNLILKTGLSIKESVYYKKRSIRGRITGEVNNESLSGYLVVSGNEMLAF